MKKFVFVAFIAAGILAGCGNRDDSNTSAGPVQPGIGNTNAKLDLVGRLEALRGTDINENGIRDDIESATETLSVDNVSRLRLLAYAWTVQQAMEASFVKDEEVLFKASQMMADTADCALQTSSDPKIAQNVVDVYSLTANSAARQNAWNELKKRVGKFNIAASSAPCALTDTLAVNILKKSKETMDRKRAEANNAHAQANKEIVQILPKEPVNATVSAPGQSPAVK